MITYEMALKAAKSGDATFIIGAGFSIGAQNDQQKKLVSGDELKEKLAKKIGLRSSYPLNVVSQDYLEQEGEKSLLSVLKEEFIVSSYCDEYNKLSTLSKAHFYTTNYDNLIEKIYEDNGKKIKSFDLSEKIDDKKKNLFVMHLNGKIEKDTNTLDNIRLTMGSYDSDFNSSPWIKYFADELKSVDAIFIVGYSLIADSDLRRLLKDHKNKCFIIQHSEIDHKDLSYLHQYGHVIENGVHKFLDDLQKCKEPTVQPISFDNLKSFIKINQTHNYQTPTDQQVFDCLIKGNTGREIFCQDINQKFTYLVNRQQLQDVAMSLNSGKNVIIHSDLGNGKSVFIQQLALIVNDRIFLEFNYNSTRDFYKEVRQISKKGENVVLVFDPYNTQYEFISTLFSLELPNIQFLLAARTAMHENIESRVEKDLKIDRRQIFDLNYLTQEECVELNDLFSKYGLWGKDASLSSQRKINILGTLCKRNFQSIILYLFDNSEIKNKLTQIIAESKSENAKKLLILSFVNVVLELQIKNTDFEILYNKIDVRSLFRSELFSEFSYYNGGEKEWCIKSAIIAKAMLNSQVFTKQEIIEILVELTKKIDKISDGGQLLKNALKHLASCSYLSFIFDYEINKKELLAYFEDVKETRFNKSNYFFWMQYAIACVNTHEYVRAGKYFDTAYSFAKSLGGRFSTFQIDNHYARFLLERQIYSRNSKGAFAIFFKAHQLLVKSGNNSIDDNNRYYQFRVARCYKDYYDIFYSDFADKEKTEFIECCKIIAHSLNNYMKENEPLSIRKDVKECRDNIRYVLSSCQE